MVENKTVIGDKLNEIKSLLGIEKDVDNTSSIEYAWYVGACGNNEDGVWTDFSDEYIKSGRWENGYKTKYTEVVKSIKVGDRIVIKSSYTKKRGLPFENNGKTVSVMALKAIGVVTENLGDGRNLLVNWTPISPIKEWYGDGVLRTTVHCIKAADGYIKQALLRFTFENAAQDYSICEEQYRDDFEEDTEDKGELPIRQPRVNNGHVLNIILYGVPGTGKTYSTACLALSIVSNRPYTEVAGLDRKELMQSYNEMVNNGKIVFTTFHQNYGYEDFIQGLRPMNGEQGVEFKPIDGVFKKIADKAMRDFSNNYVIIIDEINRANISKVFGELITLIEDDKRWGEINAICVNLPTGDKFAVPNNLYIIGTMNSADKSISLIDTALRRRFEFVEVTPNSGLIEDESLRKVLDTLNANLVDQLESTDLLIGHAYFIDKTIDDLPRIMNCSIIPLLYEYFYDNAKKVKEQVKKAIDGTGFVIIDSKVGRIQVGEKPIEV